jgi:hypothetical protein
VLSHAFTVTTADAVNLERSSMKRLYTILSALSLAFVAGCTTIRTYATSEALLREKIPVAVQIMGFQGQFDTSARSYFADRSFFGYDALKVMWEPASGPGRIRVTAEFWSSLTGEFWGKS